MINTELIPNQVVLGERNYEAALNLVIARAESELLIFDHDFSRGGYTSLKRFELLNGFLAKSLDKNVKNKLSIILLDIDYFTQYCPKLFSLLEKYGHLITVYKTNQTAKIAQDCFVIADKQHVIRRFNINQPRFKFMFDDEALAAQLNTRFNELLAETTETISYRALGL